MRSRRSRNRGHGGQAFGLEEPPHVPRPDGAIRAPPLAELLHLRGLGKLAQPVEHPNPLPNPKIPDREDIGPMKGEDEEHVDRPLADALDRGEGREERGVVHGEEGGVGEDAGVEFEGEVVEVGGLAGGDADAAELGGGEEEDGGGEGVSAAAAEGEEAGVDGGGGPGGQLLVEDAAGEGGERIGGLGFEGRGVEGVDEGGEEGVGGAEMAEGGGELSWGCQRAREDPHPHRSSWWCFWRGDLFFIASDGGDVLSGFIIRVWGEFSYFSGAEGDFRIRCGGGGDIGG